MTKREARHIIECMEKGLPVTPMPPSVPRTFKVRAEVTTELANFISWRKRRRFFAVDFERYLVMVGVRVKPSELQQILPQVGCVSVAKNLFEYLGGVSDSPTEPIISQHLRDFLATSSAIDYAPPGAFRLLDFVDYLRKHDYPAESRQVGRALRAMGCKLFHKSVRIDGSVTSFSYWVSSNQEAA